MTKQTLIAVDPDALEGLRIEMARINARLDAVQMEPKQDWFTINGAADLLKKNRKTIKRWIAAGKFETREVAGETMVQINLTS